MKGILLYKAFKSQANVFSVGKQWKTELEAAIKVFDGDPPEITLYDPYSYQNITGFRVSPFNYTVNDVSFFKQYRDRNINLMNNFSEALKTFNKIMEFKSMCQYIR